MPWSIDVNQIKVVIELAIKNSYMVRSNIIVVISIYIALLHVRFISILDNTQLMLT